MSKNRQELERELTALREELADRRQALPAHSVTPAQFALIEELEDREKELRETLAKASE